LIEIRCGLGCASYRTEDIDVISRKTPNAACALLAFVCLLSAAASHAQKFPLRQGEWTITTPDPSDASHPFVLNYCMNDQTWEHTLSKSSGCTVSDLSMTATGLSYSLSCQEHTMQMTGKGVWTFDGMEHIAAKTVMTITMNGKTNTVTSQGDFRWKGATCNPNDINLRNFNAPPKTPSQ
jgi:hypothetical protein